MQVVRNKQTVFSKPHSEKSKLFEALTNRVETGIVLTE